MTTTKTKAKLDGTRYDWTVQVQGDRYAILTKQAPFRPKGEVLYTILDYQEGMRGATNYIGNGWDMETKGPYIGSRLLHVALLAGDVEISHRARASFTGKLDTKTV